MARLSLDLGSYRPGAADALERALAGDRDAARDGRVATLLPTATALRGIDLAPGPDPDFVAALAARLAEEAEAIAAAAPAREARPARETRTARPAGRRTASSPSRPERRPAAHPVVLVVGRTVPRLAAGLVASVLAVAAVVGFGAQGSLPGQALYPVKQLIDAAQVQLAGNDLDRGTVQLAQAADHVQEARSLVADGARPSASDVDTALQLAADRTRDGRASLQAVPAADEGSALAAQGRFLEQVAPLVEALQNQVPAGSLDSLTSLRTLLTGLATQVRTQLAACNGCAPPLGQVLGVGGLGSATAPPGSVTASAGSAGSSGASPLAPVSGVSGASRATGSLPGGTALPSPGSTANLPSLGVGNSTLGGGVTVPGVGVGSSGASVGGGGVGATLPGVTATVGAPTVTVGGGGIGVGGGGIGLGGSTPSSGSTPAPSISVPLPGVTVGGSTAGATVGVGGIPVVSNTCVLGICPR